MAQMALAILESADAGAYHYFSAYACVFVDGSRRSVFVGGTLVGSYENTDKATRNAILVELSEDPKVHLGRLAEAFELDREQLRNLQKKFKVGGLSGVMEIKQGGRQRVVTPALRRKLHRCRASRTARPSLRIPQNPKPTSAPNLRLPIPIPSRRPIPLPRCWLLYPARPDLQSRLRTTPTPWH